MKNAVQFIRMMVGGALVLIGAPILTIGLHICGRDFERGFLRGWIRSNQVEPKNSQ